MSKNAELTNLSSTLILREGLPMQSITKKLPPPTITIHKVYDTNRFNCFNCNEMKVVPGGTV